MRTSTTELTALLATGDFQMAEVYTLTTIAGEALRYCSIDIPVTHGGNVFYPDVLLIKRSRLALQRGLEVDELTLEVTPVTATIGGVAFMPAIKNGALDGATLVLERCFYAAWGSEVGSLVMFTGRVSDIENGRTKATIKVKNEKELLNTKWPVHIYMPNCDWTLYGAGCAAGRIVNKAEGTVLGNTSTASMIVSDFQPHDGVWSVNGTTWGGLVKTVGVNKDYSTIAAALADTTDDILLLVYAGTYADALHSSTHFKNRKVRIKGLGTLVTDVVISGIIYMAPPEGVLSDVIFEWVELSNAESAVFWFNYATGAATNPIEISRCVIDHAINAGNAGTFYNRYNAISPIITVRYSKLFSGTEPQFSSLYSDVPANNAQLANVTMIKVWEHNATSGTDWWDWYYAGYWTRPFLADDTVHSTSEPAGYGPNSGTDIITYSATAPYASGHFDLGTIMFTSGQNNGVMRTIKAFTIQYGIEVVIPFEFVPEDGDTFEAYPGCDKQIASCGVKFGNVSNYRGCPFIPSPESAL